jgi:hypothetical protein
MTGSAARRRITAKTEEGVWLAVGPHLWSGLKLATKQRLLAGVERVAAVRTQLARKSRVQSMPPVEIACEVWLTEIGGFCHGMMSPLTHKGYALLGVKLPAPTAVIEDESLLEAIVAHEFLHCFHKLQQVIAAIRRGLHEIPDSFDSYSREEDDKRLAPVTDWFHEGIDIIHHDDPRGQKAEDYVVELGKELPIKSWPRDSYTLNSVGIPTDIRKHVELLLGSTGGSE